MKRTLLWALLTGQILAQPGLQFEEVPSSETRPPAPVTARTLPIQLSELAQLLRRLPELKLEPADIQPFVLRQSSPPPRTGQRIDQPFPGPPQGPPPTVDSGPIQIVSYSPQGNVELAPQVSITFNQPMAPDSRPAKITPQPAGEWRWVGSQTLVFQPQQRLPMASQFRVDVQADKPLQWTFATPPPQLKTSYPNRGKTNLRPLIFLEFNQRIDPNRSLGFIKLDEFALRPARTDEIAADKQVRALVKGATPDSWLALTPVEPLPRGSLCTLRVLPGLTSLEGPRATEDLQQFVFHTYAPLTVDAPPPEEPPSSSVPISFSNDLAEQEIKVTVQPEVPGLQTRIRNGNLYIYGRTRGRSHYKLTLPAGIRDVFGQETSAPITLDWKTGPATPRFDPPDKQFLLLDPTGPPELSFDVVNHPKLLVQVHGVKASDYSGRGGYFQIVDNAKLPGEVLLEREIDTGAVDDERRTVKLDLSEQLKKSNQLLVIVRPTDAGIHERVYHGWVQRTNLGVNLATDGKQGLAWISNLSDGTPVAGAQVSYLSGKVSAETGADGLATLPYESGLRALTVRHGEDTLFWPNTIWNSYRYDDDGTLWSIHDDRRIYKPGETVSVKGWLRQEIHQPHGGLELTGETALSYNLQDRNNTSLAKGTCPIDRLGGFHFQVKLPAKVDLGPASFRLQAGTAYTQHGIDIQEFRAPEFEVTARNQSPTAMIGGTGSFSVEANYFSGGGLKNAPVRWEVEALPSSHSPPHWEEYTFGTWRPWWDYSGWRNSESHNAHKTFTGTTDARGKDTLDLKFLSAEEPRPYELAAMATLSDANRQSWTSSTHMLVHPAQLYVGLKARTTFVQPGQPLEYQMVVTDLDGKLVAGRPVELKVYSQDWESKKRLVLTRQLTSIAEPLNVSFPLDESGMFTVEATVSDENNRSNRCTLTSWVAGGQPSAPSRHMEMESLTLIPNKKLYQPGETAEILVMAPFAEGRALVTLERHGLASHQFLTLDKGSATLKIPLDPDFLPNLNVTVEAVGKAPRGSNMPDRPAQARANLNLEISKASRELKVEVKPARSGVLPGTANALEVTLKDSTGQPVTQSDVALLVVDEAVLALSGHDFRNPFADFYRDRPDGVDHDGVRHLIELARVEDFPFPGGVWTSATGAAGATNVTFAENYRGIIGTPLTQSAPFDIIGNRLSGIGSFQGAQTLPGAVAFPLDIGVFSRKPPNNQKIRLRKDFSPLAFFLPNARTNGAGQIHAPFKLPDNLTRYRVVALAAASAQRFGKGESSLVARQPLTIRPSPPRFLNLGDQCEMPVLVQNQTDQAMEVALACRATNLRIDPNRAGVRFKIPANDRLEVRFPVQAEQPGTARLQFAVSSTDFADAANASIPVLTPATSEAVATYGTLDEGAVAQPVVPPKDAFQEYGGLEVSTSSTALSELTDAFLYLRKYPHECSEQISSRVLATVALEPVLRAFQSKDLPTTEELKRSLAADIQRLKLQQNDDGGWDYWKRHNPSVPWVSLHVIHTLVRLREAGHQISDDCYERALDYAGSIDKHIPTDYPTECRAPIEAYAVYILKRAGHPNVARARKLLEDWGGVENARLECLGWILPTLSKQPEAEVIRRHLNNRVTQTATTAEFASKYQDGDYLILSSDRRDDAVLLEALIQDSPESPLLPKLVRGLLAARKAGRWESTQENCFVLLALHEYFQRFEKETPDFVARLWLGDRSAGEQAFRGRSADSKELRVPINELDGPDEMVLSKEGAGRLYYRIGLKYAPSTLRVEALERGFSVQRTYEATEDNRDVVHDPNGQWHIKAGARVKVTVSMATPSSRYQVALVDPLPAGLEAINPALQGSQRPPADKRQWWSSYWYDHENMRDDRVEAFTSSLHGGYYTYTYYARATTPGHYIAPPAKAEEMYHPETFGRSATDQVTVDP